MPKSGKRKTHRAKNPKSRQHSALRSHTLTSGTVIRQRKTFLIDPASIHIPEWVAQNDEIFLRLYQKLLLGKIPGYMTRVPIDAIKEGFYVPARQFAYVCDQPPVEVVMERMQQIRLGARPPLHVYQNIHRPDPIRFMCPDDVSACLAYRRLNFETVPCVVLTKGSIPLPFSAFEIRGKPGHPTPYFDVIRIVCPPPSATLATSFGITIPSDPLSTINTLDEKLTNVIDRLKRFHCKDEDEMHYHHMLFSALIRVKETLEAITLLIRSDLWHQALALLRVLYEIHLNFCFDWLQPETNYKYLAAAAVFTTADIEKNKVEAVTHYIAEGLPEKAAEDRANSAWKPVAFATSVAEKGKLSMVGIHYHQAIYDFLSQVSHQNFEIASLHANRFDDDTFKVVNRDLKATYLRFTDFIVTEFLMNISSDIGEIGGLVDLSKF